MEDNLQDENKEYKIPYGCDIKEGLIMKLEQIDNQIYHLMQSNDYMQQETENTQDNDEATIREYKDYIKENEDLILDKKNEVIKIVSAFIKAGTNIQKEVYPKMIYKSYYMPGFQDDHVADIIIDNA